MFELMNSHGEDAVIKVIGVGGGGGNGGGAGAPLGHADGEIGAAEFGDVLRLRQPVELIVGQSRLAQRRYGEPWCIRGAVRHCSYGHYQDNWF